MAKFEYRGYTQQQFDKKKREITKGWDSFVSDEFDFFKVTDGRNNIRFLPATWDDADYFGLVIHVHYGIGADNGSYLCPNKMGKEDELGRCPICAERERAQNCGDDDYLYSLSPQKRLLVYVINRDKEEEGPLVWAMPKGLATEVPDYAEDEETGGILAFDHPDEGFDFTFTAENAGKKTCKYKKLRFSSKASPISSDGGFQDDVLDLIVEKPLPAILQWYDSKYLEEKFMAKQSVAEETIDDITKKENEVEDDSPTTSRTNRRFGRNKKDEDKPQEDNVNDSTDTKDDGDSQDDNVSDDTDTKEDKKTDTRSKLNRFKNRRTTGK